jgi:glycosyltransferase involved in cell wall biosynthesis
VIFNTSLHAEAEVKDAVDFCRSIVPAVRARIPQTRFVITSKDGIHSLGAGVQLNGVEVLSPAPDLRLLFHDQAVAAAPLHAGFDVRSSVLAAMAAGVPVVTTSRVRAHLGASAGRDLAVADGPGDFGRELVELLQSSTRRGEMGASGREFARAAFSWEVFAAHLETLLVNVGERRPADAAAHEPPPIPAALGG